MNPNIRSCKAQELNGVILVKSVVNPINLGLRPLNQSDFYFMLHWF